ncbi:Alpha/beta hydrolase [Alphaproteobacteria bacterium]
MREVVFNGAAGRLEGKYYRCEEENNAPAALILHPHPLHGGTMNNKVVYSMFHSFVRNKFSVLRFNFRGVAKSMGTFDQGIGELLDAATALDWLQNDNPEASSYWIAGFSFGAWIALQLLMRRPEVNGFAAVAVPANLYDFNFLSPCPTQGLIIQGSQDEIVLEESVYKLYERIDKQHNANIEYHIINTDHFFDNKLDELGQIVDEYLKVNVNRHMLQKKLKRDRRKRNYNENVT